MKVLLQRVTCASVEVSGATVAAIDQGLLLLVGVARNDTENEATWLANKVAGLRVFDDDDGQMNLSVGETGGQALVVSQFTLLGNSRRGRRPSYTDAAEPARACQLVDFFIAEIRAHGIEVASGVFGAEMTVNLSNNGPVTLVLEKEAQ